METNLQAVINLTDMELKISRNARAQYTVIANLMSALEQRQIAAAKYMASPPGDTKEAYKTYIDHANKLLMEILSI